ncbi:peptidoglycan DD-metalloendopeptidase family protein [uncultured Algibacter sp.]|uniref:peptidoglycan DD-metalloendopeptidase family protein n=1 Tax=uncultured Algibacter sp. TaxID=298659 RepID=UPI00262AC2A3|nr:peptidoglycan DD-metalloendopeptidase family protein [uncultured Algibacter sp.]
MTLNPFSKFINSISSEPLFVLDSSIPNEKYIPIDLSESNEELNKIDVSSSQKLAAFVNNHIVKEDHVIAYGGYLEVRNIYKRSEHFNAQAQDERNIHLGIDLWCNEGSTIYAPLNGMVYGYANNTGYGDYGPTIILKHNISGVEFYTLYGHLSLSSLKDLEPGKEFEKGDCIGKLGDASVNGDYPPHLHFQIIKDIEGYYGDYPGVCNKDDLDFYRINCPNPCLLLKL